MLNNLKDWLKNIKTPADRIAFRYVREDDLTIATRDQRPEHNYRSLVEGLMVEVHKNGHVGYAATDHLEISGVKKAVEIASQQAERLSQMAIYKSEVKDRPVNKGEFISQGFQADSLSLQEINSRLINCDKKLKVSDKIISSSSSAHITDLQTIYVCSLGSEIYQKFRFTSTGLSAIAKEGSTTQKRTNFGRNHSLQAGFEMLDADLLYQRAQHIGEQALELVVADICPTDTRDLVLAPDQMMLQIHESIGHPLELDRILGDERNYAGSSFVKLKDFGKLQYGSPVMNIVFDPTETGEFACYGYDDSGMKAAKEYLIKEGVLLRGLGSTESMKRSGVPGVANFRATSWNRAPIDRMANINLEAGSDSLEDIISSVEKGVYMESNSSWSIDDYRNKFQFSCEYGKLIENGKLTKTVRNPGYRGITTPFWNNLKKVGGPQTYSIYGTPFCGKGEPNQAIRVGHGSPVCLFENIEVFGGES